MAGLKSVLSIIVTVVVFNNVQFAFSMHYVFPIGGLFNNDTLKYSETAFTEISVPKNTISTKSYTGRVIKSVHDSYSYALEVCQNTTGIDGNPDGVIALIDARPTNGICDITCLLCKKLQIAHLSVGWEPIESSNNEQLPTFSYYPSPASLSKAYATLIRHLGWDRFAFFYEDDSSFVRLQEVIGSWDYSKEPITYRKLSPDSDNENRETFKYVVKTSRISHHILDCDIKNIETYIRQFVEVENSTQTYHSFILTNLDAYTVTLSGIPNMNLNISTFFMTFNDSTPWKDIGINPEGGIKMETALTKDALEHLEKAIREMTNEDAEDEEGEEAGSRHIECLEPPALCFDSKDPWCSGDKLSAALFQTKINGVTGLVQFDEKGRRTNFKLYYAQINKEKEFDYSGVYDSKTDELKLEDSVISKVVRPAGVIRVISRDGLPYFKEWTDEEGVKHARGYAVDLATKIFETIKKEHNLKFELTFREVYDGNYGNPIEGSRKWNGIMGELMDHTADLGICDLTITSERSSVVDFSIPFMTTGISMLFKEPDPEEPDMFSFINPLSLDVWLYLATTYIVVSFIFLICARMSNLDWVNPHPCNQNPENLENIWSFYNCTWFAMGTIMTQGCDILPRGLGSRWIAGMWWFFAMIVTASYTANMSTFLSNSRRNTEITNVKQLSEHPEYTYGTVKDASTYKFFKKSDDPVYSKIFQAMETARPTVYARNNDEGRDRVNNTKNYVFFMESTAIRYYTERNCTLKMVGQPLDSKSYGIAMPKEFEYKALVDSAILVLQEGRDLQELESKWWKEEDNPGKGCGKEEEGKQEDDGSLQMKNTSGIFLVLGVGGILGLIVAVIDFLIHANKIAVKEKLTFKEAVISEWNASLNPRTMAKPVAPPRSVPPSESPSPRRERSTSRAMSVIRAASSFINFDNI